MTDREAKDADTIALEEPLDATLPICDAHHHLWQRPAADYLLDDLLKDLRSGHNIDSTVAIECRYSYRAHGPEDLRPIGETEFLESLANRVGGDSTIKTRVGAAIVGHANLALGDRVTPVLEAHLEASPGRFRGIRHLTTWNESDALRSDAPQGLLADSEFRRGFGRLQRLGLSFDAWLYHPQLSELADLARAFPDTMIILDHIGAPLGVGPYAGKRDEVYQAWSKGLATLADCPNVAVKLGGIGSSRSGYDWHERPQKPSSAELAETLKPYIERCIETFGVRRCMFESNFPVEKLSNHYVNLWNAFKRITEKYSERERTALFHDTAARVYRI
jgi:predicted TIM-barrel fold metal-dependent hydrolase